MEFLFFSAANKPLFSRSDAEKAEWTVQEYQLQTVWPYDPEKVIQNGMRILFYDQDGTAQAFEIFRTKNHEPDHYQEVTAEHICISELTDEHFPQADFTDLTAGAALEQILTGTLWQVGTDTSTGTSSADIGMGNVWQDVRTIESSWNVYITPRVTVGPGGITGRYLDIAPAAPVWSGIRLSINKNMDEAGITYDDSDVKTAAYGYGRSVQTEGAEEAAPLTFADVEWTETADHPAKPLEQTYLEDPAATAAYGRNGRARFGFYQNGNITEPEILLQKTWEWLQTVNKPNVSIDCVVADLYRMGYADEPIRLHGLALVDIEPIGVQVRLEIVQLMIDLLDASQTRPTIGSYIPNIVYIERETNERASGGGGGGGGQSNAEYKISEFETEIGANEYQISLRAYQRDMTNVENILKESGVAIDASGTIIYANNNLNDMKAAIETNAQAITLKVSAGDIASTINQTAQSVLIQASKINLQGYVTASELSAELASIEIEIASGVITEALQADDAYITRLQVAGTGVNWRTQYVITGINTKTVTFIDADDVQHSLNVFQNNNPYSGTTLYYLGRTQT